MNAPQSQVTGRTRAPSGRPFAALSELCLAAALVLSVAALGGAAPFAYVPHALLSLAALVLAFLSARANGEPLQLSKLSLLFLFAGAACLLQLIPLPLPLLNLASPEAAELVRFNLEPLGLSTTRPISLDPAATARELAKALSYGALLSAAGHLCRSRTVRRRLFFVVSGMGAAVALTACVHALLGAEALFGLYKFSSTPQLITPFGNPNHLAGFLTVTATLTLGLFLEVRGAPVRMGLALAYLLQASVCMFSGSRAGIVFFAAAQLLLAALAFRSRKRREELFSARVLAAGVVICALSVAAYVGWERLSGEYEATASAEKVRESKVKLWPQYARGAGAYSRLGMGRGVFELGYARHHPHATYYLFTHPENVVLQLWSEFGMLIAMGLLLFGAWAFARLFRREEPTLTDFAALSATAAVCLHNLFDFSLELIAVPTALALLLGAVSRRGDEAKAFSLEGNRGVGALSIFAVTLAFALLRSQPTFQNADQALIAALSKDSSAKGAEAAALPLIDQHPADGLLYSAVGLSYANDRAADPLTALAWLNRGLYLSPWHGPSHHAVARALLRAGKRHQAFGEYRLALESYAGVPRHHLIREAVRAAKTADELVRLTPRQMELVLTMANFAQSTKEPKLVIEALQTLIPDVEPARTRIPLFVRLAELRSATGDVAGAVKALDGADALRPDDASVSIFRAQLLSQAGSEKEAQGLLESEVTRFPGDFRLHMAVVNFHLHRDPNKALTALGRARGFADTPEQQYAVFLAEAQAYQRSERYARAVQSAESAARLAPKHSGIRYLVADIYAQLGRFNEARRWLKDGMANDSKEGAEAALKARESRWAVEEARVVELKDKALLEDEQRPQLRIKEEP